MILASNLHHRRGKHIDKQREKKKKEEKTKD
jgi:hypothetical protein